MGLLESLLNNVEQQQDARDFVNRYEQGPPQEGYTGQEVLNRYQQVAPQIPPDTYEQAATEAFQRMSPEQRTQFAQSVQQQAQQQNVAMPMGASASPSAYQDPRQLAQMVAGLHQQQPGMLGQLLGGSGGGGAGSLLENPAAKAALAGIAAIALKQMMSPR